MHSCLWRWQAMPWWAGNSTISGDDVCAHLKRGTCQHVVQPDGSCHHNHCDHAANPGQIVFCGPDPTPAGGWPCMDCSGKCGPCGLPPPTPGVKPSPNWQGCTDATSKALPYCDATKSIDERVNWLVGQMSLEEKISAISPQPNLGDTCGVYTCGKESVGLPNYFWLTETNTAVAAACYTADPTEQYRCATTFVGPMNMVRPQTLLWFPNETRRFTIMQDRLGTDVRTTHPNGVSHRGRASIARAGA
jgi:hypothetical protein